MKVVGKPIAMSVGLFFIGFALIAAAPVFSGAKGSQSPLLYICVFGGLFVLIPAALGIGLVLENLRNSNRVRAKSHD